MPELIAYQDAALCAASTSTSSQRVRAAEQAGRARARRGSARRVARYLFKLMAYKDEYEVARLHLQADLARSLAEEFPGGVRVQYNLHPPLLRALGLKQKLKLGSWFDGAFRAAGRDEGPARHRARSVRLARRCGGSSGRCPASTASSSSARSAACRPSTYERAVTLARLPDLIRGYEDIKLANVEKFRAEVRALGV